MKPRDWCEPSDAFGDPDATTRAWKPPTRQSDLAEFRGAVVQHAVSISVRRYKNRHGWSQPRLAEEDGRGQNYDKWNRRLNGQQTLSMVDLAAIVRLLPGAMPSEGSIRRLLNVAEGGRRPAGWKEVDTKR